LKIIGAKNWGKKDDMEKTRIQMKIFGRVQGVGFRYFAKTMADQLHIMGYVRNEYDESVFIDAQGRKEDIDRFIAYISKGPSYGEVHRIDKIYISEEANFNRFDIRH